MIDFPITEQLSDAECVKWLEAFLRPEGLICPHCNSAERRLFREQGYFQVYRCLNCDGYYTLLSDTVFEKTHQRPATLVLLLRGIAKGESSVRLSRELGMGRKRVMELRHAIQNNLYETLPRATMDGQIFEADEVYQNAGKKAGHIWTRTTRPAVGPTKPRDAAPMTTTVRIAVGSPELIALQLNESNKPISRGYSTGRDKA